jgi:hypothetical protein
MSRTRTLAATLAACLCTVAPASAVPSAKMSASFTPYRLGAPTAISASFQIQWSEPRPPVLAAAELAFPRDFGFATSGLGLAACDPVVLQEEGPKACPPNSRMGSGSALVEVPLGGFLHQESVALAVLAGPSPGGYLRLLVSAEGALPVTALVVLYAELLPGRLSIAVPPIPTLPEGPHVALVSMHLTLGGRLTYYERRHGRNVAYHPTGIGLPSSCPRRGFQFATTFTFADGRRAVARATVACPRRSRR